MTRPLRLGTRASKLARWQADWTAAELERRGCKIEIVEVSTRGDLAPEPHVAELGSVGVFTKEIQQALLAGEVDFAVHSMKDLPTTPVPGLSVVAIPQREVAADALVSRSAKSLDTLPEGARVGTSSLRRQAQLRRLRSDLDLLDIRGNIDTRLAKLDAGQFDAIVLASAGLYRLKLQEHITQLLSLEAMVPAPGQGALAIECRENQPEVSSQLLPLADPVATACVVAERTMLAEVEGGCLAAVGGHAIFAQGLLHLDAVVLSRDGTHRLHAQGVGDLSDPHDLGARVAAELIAQGARELLERRE